MQKKKKLVILLDGNSYLYRNYYGVMSLKRKNHEPLNMIYGILNTIKNIILRHKPHKLIMIFDSKKNNFRKKIFPEYKKNRLKMPKNLKIQIPIINNIIQYIGIPILIVPHFEADDVIGTLSKIEEKKGNNVLIGTCDKDLAQLVTNKIKILNNINHSILGPNDIKKKYGVPPDLIIDLLSLVGDQSDNIPGVYGIGKKTAISLLKKNGSIKKIYHNIKEIKISKIKNKRGILKKLYNGKDMAFLSYKLIKIKKNINIIERYKKINLIDINKSIQYNSKYHKIITNTKKIIQKNIKHL